MSVTAHSGIATTFGGSGVSPKLAKQSLYVRYSTETVGDSAHIAFNARQGWSVGATRCEADFSTRLGLLDFALPLVQAGDLPSPSGLLILGGPARTGDAVA